MNGLKCPNVSCNIYLAVTGTSTCVMKQRLLMAKNDNALK
jgi:hypothetical protein